MNSFGVFVSQYLSDSEALPSNILAWARGQRGPGLRFVPAIVEFLGYDPTPKLQTMGEQLVRYRRLQGWTQKKMAKRLSVDPGTLARWERGERQPAGPFLQRVEKIVAEQKTEPPQPARE